MKKFSATVISMILCLILSACANSVTSSNVETGKNSNSFESITNESKTSTDEESNGGDMVRTVCFYNDEKRSQLSCGYAYKKIHCDDYDKAIKDFFDEYYTNPDGIDINIQDLLIMPYEYIPIIKAVEKSDTEKKLQLNSVVICAQTMIYNYNIDEKGGLEFCITKADKSGYPVNEDELFIPDKFTIPKEVTGVEPNEFDYCHMGNKINGNIVKYSFKFSSRETYDVDIVIGDYQLQINKQYPWESELPYFLFDEEQLSDFIKNLEEVIYNEKIDYKSE